MALTLTDALALTNEMLVRGVVETIISQSAVLRRLPFLEVTGNALAYPREATTGSAQYNAIGGTWTESAPTFTQVTEQLRILGGDADVDNFLRRTYSSTNDIEAVVLAEKAKAVAYQFSDTFFNGDISVDANSFDGLHKRVGAGQTLSAGTNGGTLTFALLDQLVDLVKPGVPDVLYMSRRTRRQLNNLRRTSGSLLETANDAFGNFVMTYDGIPVEIDDFIKDDRTVGSGTNCSTIYAVQHGFETGLMGLHNGGVLVDRFPALETKDATRARIKWYCGITIFRPVSCAKLAAITYP